MAGKENSWPTTDPRRLINHSFRVAKPLPDRKRALGSPSKSPLSKCSNYVKTSDITPPRIPLLEINAVPYCQEDGFTTLAKASQIYSIMDDELDDEFLREVDVICEQQSTVKKEKNMDTDGIVPDKFCNYLQNLNDEQREAACSDSSIPLMIVAGPGSGKTSTMVGRVLKLLKEGIGPSKILAMTFTTAAASEMRDRIGAVVGKAVAKEITISTFHSFCLQLCRLHAGKLNRTSEFVIYGHGQQRRAVIEALRLVESGKSTELGGGIGKVDKCSNTVSPQKFKDKSRKWQKYVTQAKASGRTPEECKRTGNGLGAIILQNYNDILTSCNALDYHDFICSSVKLLTNFPEVHKECLDRWHAIIVDEFQDTSSMQYHLLKILASHNRITIVGDDDQSIFGFNGADVSGFESFRRDFPGYKEIRLSKNYRSTRCIVEAASSLIHNNTRRCHFKKAVTDNSVGCKISIKECHNEDAQCAYVIDKILEITSDNSTEKCSLGNIAILYRRQVSGKPFQLSFRNRGIPFNVHGVAFYRKKVIKAVMAMLRTTLPGCEDGPYRQAFKALLPGDKEEKKKVIEHIDKISTVRNCSFISVATDIFSSKVSGTFKRSQLTQGRRVLSSLDMLAKLVERERSISVVVSCAASMVPQKYLLEQRAIVDVDGGKLLNEDTDSRSVLDYLLGDVSDFLSLHFTDSEDIESSKAEGKGCRSVLKAFLDYITVRETENFQTRRRENKDSVTLTTIHQSKGLEWDIVFIVKANESEIPLLHEFNGMVQEGGSTLEEERRLLYVAMTRARKKLYILYVIMDLNWQFQQPSRFLKEIPACLLDIEAGASVNQTAMHDHRNAVLDMLKSEHITEADEIRPKSISYGNVSVDSDDFNNHVVDRHGPGSTFAPNIIKSEPSPAETFSLKNEDDTVVSGESVDISDLYLDNSFLKRFNLENRSIVSHLFHQWAKKAAFQQPKRLLDKVSFVIDERLRNKTNKNKDTLRALRSCLDTDEAFQYAQYVLKWEKIPLEKRTHIMREKQEHFQKQRIEQSMETSNATPKQISYLQSLGCTITPTSRLHASRLIEQYKSL